MINLKFFLNTLFNRYRVYCNLHISIKYRRKTAGKGAKLTKICRYNRQKRVYLLTNIFSVPSQEQALQQVILLKKELAEIRAKQAMEEDRHFQAQLNLDKEVST